MLPYWYCVLWFVLGTLLQFIYQTYIHPFLFKEGGVIKRSDIISDDAINAAEELANSLERADKAYQKLCKELNK